MDSSNFESIRTKFGGHASWAYWSMPEKAEPKTARVGDLSVFVQCESSALLSTLHTNYVLMGLNMSRSSNESVQSFSNFHDARAGGRDYRLRYAIQGTPLWGSYMTDFFVNLVDPKASRVMTYARSNPTKVMEQVEARKEELTSVGAENAVLVALGNDVHRLLVRYFGDRKIIKIPHYSAYIKLEKYRETVREVFQSEGH